MTIRLPAVLYEYDEERLVDLIVTLRGSMLARIGFRLMASRANAGAMFDFLMSDQVPANVLARAIVMLRDCDGDVGEWEERAKLDPEIREMFESIRSGLSDDG